MFGQTPPAAGKIADWLQHLRAADRSSRAGESRIRELIENYAVGRTRGQNEKPDLYGMSAVGERVAGGTPIKLDTTTAACCHCRASMWPAWPNSNCCWKGVRIRRRTSRRIRISNRWQIRRNSCGLSNRTRGNPPRDAERIRRCEIEAFDPCSHPCKGRVRRVFNEVAPLEFTLERVGRALAAARPHAQA